MSRPKLKLGDLIQIDEVPMRIDEIRITHAGVSYHVWWLSNGDMHETVFSEVELFEILKEARDGGMAD